MYMKMRRFWWLGVGGVVAALLGLSLVVPAWASPSGHGDGPGSDAYIAMHAACEAGDIEGMTEGMDGLTKEDWAAMQEHMGSGHHGAMGSGMMAVGGMMGEGSDMTSWR